MWILHTTKCIRLGPNVMVWWQCVGTMTHQGWPTKGWLPLVGSFKLYVSFAKEPYKRDDILHHRPKLLRSLLMVATPYLLENYRSLLKNIVCFYRSLLQKSPIKETIFWIIFISAARAHMGWLCLVGSIKLQVSFAKEPYKRDDILQKGPIILSILLTVATP